MSRKRSSCLRRSAGGGRQGRSLAGYAFPFGGWCTMSGVVAAANPESIDALRPVAG
jgi:hypothetical protein